MYLEKEAIDYFRKYEIELPAAGNRLGHNPSRRPGRNLEFEKYKPYLPGDDIRGIDWKVYARTEKLFLKDYGSDLRSDSLIVLDSSASMDYGGKFGFAKKTAAILFHLLSAQKNEVRFAEVSAAFKDHGLLTHSNVETRLDAVRAHGRTEPSHIRTRPAETVFFLSDLWFPVPEVESLAERGVHLIHVCAPEELELDIAGSVEFEDSETGAKLAAVPSEIRAEYVRRMNARLETIRASAGDRSAGYGLFRTDELYYVQLKDFFEFFKHAGTRRRHAVP